MNPTDKNQQQINKLMTPDEVVELLHIPKGTLYQWSYSGNGPKVLKIGRHLRYRLNDVETWLDKCG